MQDFSANQWDPKTSTFFIISPPLSQPVPPPFWWTTFLTLEVQMSSHTVCSSSFPTSPYPIWNLVIAAPEHTIVSPNGQQQYFQTHAFFKNLATPHQEVETISPSSWTCDRLHEQNVAKTMGHDFRGYIIKFSIIPPGVLILSLLFILPPSFCSLSLSTLPHNWDTMLWRALGHMARPQVGVPSEILAKSQHQPAGSEWVSECSYDYRVPPLSHYRWHWVNQK